MIVLKVRIYRVRICRVRIQVELAKIQEMGRKDAIYICSSRNSDKSE